MVIGTPVVMRCFQRFSILSVLGAATLADLATSLAPRWDEVVLKSGTVPVDWVALGDPPVDIAIDLHFALKPYHGNALIDALIEVCNPMHRKYVLSDIFPQHLYYPSLYSYVSFLYYRYGTDLSWEQADVLVAPRPHAFELVTSWLDYHGVPSSSISTIHDDGWLTVTDVPVSQANKLLNASYQLYRQTGTNDTTILRTVSYGLPAMLLKYVETVVPTMCFAPTRTLPRRRSVEVRQEGAKVEEDTTATAGVTLRSRAGDSW